MTDLNTPWSDSKSNGNFWRVDLFDFGDIAIDHDDTNDTIMH